MDKRNADKENGPARVSNDELRLRWQLMSGADPVPKVAVPTPPAGERPALTLDEVRRLSKPNDAQEADAAAVVQEVANAPHFVDDFGKFAPARDAVAGALAQAVGWTQQADAASVWAAYVGTERLLAWDAALRLLHGLHDDFDVAAKHDPTIAARYPSLAHFFAAPKVVAARGLATKRVHKHADADPKAAAPVTTPGGAPATTPAVDGGSKPA